MSKVVIYSFFLFSQL